MAARRDQAVSRDVCIQVGPNGAGLGLWPLGNHVFVVRILALSPAETVLVEDRI